jgi:hypothetical protein
MGILSAILFGDRDLDFSIDYKSGLVKIFSVRTIGVAVEMPDLWQNSAFCKEVGYSTFGVKRICFLMDILI